MVHPMNEDVFTKLQCPCLKRVPLRIFNEKYYCTSVQCEHSIANNGFITYKKKPVIINFNDCDTVCCYSDYTGSNQAFTSRPRHLTAIREKISRAIGKKSLSFKNCLKFINELKKINSNPSVLIVGSGTIGNGAEPLYQDNEIDIFGIDIYPSPNVDYIADAHYIPFKDESFDGVWIQAVLEHVLRPTEVVAEINRILKPNGLIYSEIPFMQQVHEGAYDFQRYTPIGHVAIYSKNIIVSSGVLGGPGDSFTWSTRYLIWALFRSRSMARILAMPLRWLMIAVDFMIPSKYKNDNCTGSYVMAKKPEESFQASARELIRHYAGCQR